MSDRQRGSDADVVDRLARLRTILPLIATDLATARRHAHTLALENRRLAMRIAELESRIANQTTHEYTHPETGCPAESANGLGTRSGGRA